MPTDARLIVEIEGKDNLTKELKRIESSVIRFVGAMSSALTVFSGISFPILEAAEFQKELLNAAKTTNYASDQLSVLRSALRDISTQTNVTAVDLAKIATMGGQIGIGADGNTAALIEFVKSVSVAATALDLSAEEVVASFGKLINLFDIPQGQFRNAISALNEVSNVSNATADQLFDVVRRIGDLGGAVNLPQAAALSASMIDLGLTAETAGTTITKIFADFKAKAGEFASIVRNDTIKATDDWVRLLSDGRGLDALRAYLDALNNMTPAEAAATKARLTGQGRLFESITKLQAQRRREVFAEEEAAKASKAHADAVERSKQSFVDPQILEALRLRAEFLGKAAENASVLARLTTAADRAFRSGDSAEQEQRVVLGGLSAQWTVFFNNIKQKAGEVGSTVLPAITNALKRMSSAMQDSGMDASLRNAASDILQTVNLLGSAIGALAGSLSSLQSSGFDWGAAFHLATLLGVVVAVKSLGSLFGVLADRAATALLPIRAAGASFANMVSQATRASVAITSTSRSFEGISRAGAQVAAAGQGLQSVGLAAAETVTKITSTLGIFPRVTAAIKGLSNEYRQLQALKARAEANIASSTEGIANAPGRITALLAKARYAYLNDLEGVQTRLVTQQLKYEEAIARGDRRAAGQYLRQANELRTLYGQITAVIAQTERYQRILQLSKSILGKADAGLAGLGVGAGARLDNATASAKGVAAKALSSMISGAATTAIVIGRLTLAITGMETAWKNAGGAAEKAFVAAKVGASLFGSTVRGIGALVSKAFTVFVIAQFAVDLLKMIGLWDKLAGAIEKVAKALGIEVPDFLKSEESLKAQARIVDDLRKKNEALFVDAGRFNGQMQALVLTAQSLKEVQKDLVFTPEAPTSAADNFGKYLDAIDAGNARLKERQIQVEILNRLIDEQSKKLTIVPKGMSAEDAKKFGADKPIYDRIKALKDEKAAVEAEIAAMGNFDTGLRNVMEASLTAGQAQELFGRATAVSTSLVDRFVQARKNELETAQRLNEEENKAAPDAGSAARDTVAAVVESQRILTGSAAKLRQARTDYQDEVAKFAAQIQQAAPDGIGKKITDTILNDKDIEHGRAMLQRLISVYQTGALNFKGLSAANIKSEDILGAGVEFEITRRVQQMYQSWAGVARTAADRAKNYAVETAREVEKRLQQSVKLAESLTNTIKDKQQKAANQIADKRDAAESRQKEHDIKVQFDQERALIEQTFGIQRRGLAEQEAGGRRVSFQKQQSYAAEQQAYFNLEERENALLEKERERLAMKQAKRNSQQDIAEIDKLIKKEKDYIEELKKVNEVINNPNASLADKNAALVQRDSLLRRTTADYDLLGEKVKDLANTDPIGGQLVVPPQDIARLSTAVQDIAKGIGAVQSEAAGAVHGVLDASANQFESMSAKAQKSADEAGKRFRMLATLSKGGFEGAKKELEQFLSRTPELANAVKSLQGRLDEGLIDPTKATALSDEAVKTIIQNIKDGIADAKNTVGPIPFEVTVDAVSFVQQAMQALDALAKEQGGSKIPVSASPESLDAMKGQIEGLNPTIKATIQPVGINGATGTIKLEPAAAAARGGLIADLLATVASARKYAVGGRITGPGGPTDDKVLMWGSNGEFVMDALTTARFGAKFFYALQAAARGGISSRLLDRISIPGFAAGGPISAGSYPLAGSIATDFKHAQQTRDIVDVRLTMGDKKATIQAERDQASNLVNMLKGLNRGR